MFCIRTACKYVAFGCSEKRMKEKINSVFSTNFGEKIIKYKVSRKSVHRESSFSMRRVRMTDMTKLIVTVRNLEKAPNNKDVIEMIGSRRDYSGLCPVKDYFISGDEPRGSDITEFVSQSTRPCHFILLKRAATDCRIIHQPDSEAAISASVTVYGKWKTQSCS